MPPSLNPEAMVNAAVAAKAAELAANQAFFISLIIVVMLLVVGAAMMLIAYNFDQLKRNTDGLMEQLVVATRKLALIEGNVAGRTELKKENDGKVDVTSEHTQTTVVSKTETSKGGNIDA